jgi:hypothetical protein
MAAFRGQKPRLRHDDGHGIFRQAMDLIEVTLFHDFLCLNFQKECNRFQDFVNDRPKNGARDSGNGERKIFFRSTFPGF